MTHGTNGLLYISRMATPLCGTASSVSPRADQSSTCEDPARSVHDAHSAKNSRINEEVDEVYLTATKSLSENAWL